MHPITFLFKRFKIAEINYDVYNKELLAIIRALKEWRVYLEGVKH